MVEEDTTTQTMTTTSTTTEVSLTELHTRRETYRDTKEGSFVSSTVVSTTETLRKFQEEREMSQKIIFAGVVTSGWQCLLFGIIVYFFDFFLYSSIDVYRKQGLLSRIISSLSMFFVQSGVVLVSTVPTHLLDIDKECRVRATSKNWYIRYVIAATGGLASLCPMVLYPFVMICNFFICLSMVYTDDTNIRNRMTYKMALWYQLYVFNVGIICIVWSEMAYNSMDGSSKNLVRMDVPCHPIYFFTYLIAGVFCVLGAVALSYYIRNRRKEFENTGGQDGCSPTTIVYISIYGMNAMFGIALIIIGVGYSTLLDHPAAQRDLHLFVAASFGVGLAMLMPTAVVLLLGPNKLFSYMARRFDKDPSIRQKDGAFIAGLLDGIDVKIGFSWWIHRKSPDESYDKVDPRRNWKKGKVCSIDHDSSEFVVEVDGDQHAIVPMGKTINSDELLELAKTNLRCIDYAKMIEQNLFDKSPREELDSTDRLDFYAISRAVKENESIDFFISHSWSDDGKSKFEAIKEVGEKFHKKNNHYPTFWFDKVCINQNDIGAGLKVLPINIMACKKLLVLAGETYAKRLWCVWELCTLFAFVQEEEALNMVELIHLDAGNDVLNELKTFDHTYAHCYDPNEENKIRAVITGVGVVRFHKRIQNLAKELTKKIDAQDSPVEAIKRVIQRRSRGNKSSFSAPSSPPSSIVIVDAD